MKKILSTLLLFSLFSCVVVEAPKDDLQYLDIYKGNYKGYTVTNSLGKVFELPYNSITTKVDIMRNSGQMLVFTVEEYDYSTLKKRFSIKPFSSVEKDGNIYFKDLKSENIAFIGDRLIWVKQETTNTIYHFYK